MMFWSYRLTEAPGAECLGGVWPEAGAFPRRYVIGFGREVEGVGGARVGLTPRPPLPWGRERGRGGGCAAMIGVVEGGAAMMAWWSSLGGA
jgi:hypothetical protein